MNRTLLVSLLAVIGVAMVCCLQTLSIPKFCKNFGQQKDFGNDAKGQHQPPVCERDECQKTGREQQPAKLCECRPVTFTDKQGQRQTFNKCVDVAKPEGANDRHCADFKGGKDGKDERDGKDGRDGHERNNGQQKQGGK